MKLTHLKHADIDRVAWDEALANSLHPLIYAHTFYLDIVSPGWEAIVAEDYSAIFPLPIKQKLGIPYIAHPLFCQQLGIFYSDENLNNADEFISEIPSKFRRRLIRLNHWNSCSQFELSERVNYVLSIGEKAEDNYNTNTKRNLKKAMGYGQEITGNVEIEEFIALKKANSKAKLKDEDWERMWRLISDLIERGLGFFRSVRVEGELVSAVFYAHWKNRYYYLFSASSELGMEVRSSFLIVNDLITTIALSGDVLDFEGSMSPSISRFFKGFGATKELYFEYKKRI